MDEEKELLSVIVPIYNAEPYLNQCLDSIINQRYRKLEIILVDVARPIIPGDCRQLSGRCAG